MGSQQQLNAAKKDIFNLQLENHFLKERLANMAPDQIEGALNENVKLKLEILNISKEMKKLKKILTQQDKDLAEAQKERENRLGRGGADLREVEALYREEKERRRAIEQKLEEEIEARGRVEEDLESAKGTVQDHLEEAERLRDAVDRAEDELDRVKSGLGDNAADERNRQDDIEELEEVSAAKPLFAIRMLIVQQVNSLRDQLAAAQLDVDRRDAEIEQLNEELDIKVREHEKEITQVEAEWRDEVLEARAQVDELKDVSVDLCLLDS